MAYSADFRKKVLESLTIVNALNPSYKSSLNIAQMRKDWRKCRMKK